MRHKLETIELETLEDSYAIEADIETFLSSIPNTVLADWWGTDEDTTIISKRIDDYNKLRWQRHLAFQTRGLATQLLACLPGCISLARERAARIESDFHQDNHSEATARAFKTLIEAKIQSKWSSEKAAVHRKQLESQLLASDLLLVDQAGEIERGLLELKSRIDEQLVRQKDGLRLVAQLDRDGQLARLYQPA